MPYVAARRRARRACLRPALEEAVAEDPEACGSCGAGWSSSSSSAFGVARGDVAGGGCEDCGLLTEGSVRVLADGAAVVGRSAIDGISTCASSEAGWTPGSEDNEAGEAGESSCCCSARDEQGPEQLFTPPSSPDERASLVAALASVLTKLALVGDTTRRTWTTRFDSSAVPNISIRDYLRRVCALFRCSDECVVFSLVYIDRITKMHPKFAVTSWNVHRLVVTSMMVTAKFWDDKFYTTSHYSKVAGVKAKELITLETQFLKLIDWHLLVPPSEYEMYLCQLLMAAQGQSCIAAAPAARPGR